MKYAIVLVLVSLASGRAFADEVHLKNGNTLVGVTREEGDRIVVELGAGTAAIPKSDVVKVVFTKVPLHEYPERLKQAEAGGKPGHWFGLALWAKDSGLTRYVSALLERTIALDPEHKAAREMLGYVIYDGRWMTKTESMQAQGFVRFRDGWMKAAERDSILALEAARREESRLAAALRQAARTPERVAVPVLYMGIPPYRDIHSGFGRRSILRIHTSYGWRGWHGGGHHHSPGHHEGRHGLHHGHH